MKIFILEDEPLLKDLLVSYIQDFTEFTVAGVSDNGSEALDCIARTHPNIIIADIQLPGVNGLEILDRVKQSNPDTKVILYSGEFAPRKIQYAYEHDADGLLQKGRSMTELSSAIDTVSRGDRYFSEEALDIVSLFKENGSA